MAVMVLMSLPLGWLGMFAERVRQQKEILGNLEEYPGCVEWRFGHVVRLEISGTEVTDAGLENIKGLTRLETLEVSCSQITDAGLEHLKGLAELEWLCLADTQVTDVGLRHLKGLTRLETLLLYDTQVTDAGLEHLKGLKKLKMLMLGGTHVTEDGVEHLQQALPNCHIDSVTEAAYLNKT